jgi:hypothetical protein
MSEQAEATTCARTRWRLCACGAVAPHPPLVMATDALNGCVWHGRALLCRCGVASPVVDRGVDIMTSERSADPRCTRR